jgi:hypothetical protein
VSEYLLSSGYGSRSLFFGKAAITGRIGDHLDYLARDFRPFFAMGTFIAAVAAIEAAKRLRRSPRAWFQRNRDLVALWAAVGLCTAALLSSANRGVWFATPVDSLLVVGVVATGTRLLRGRARPGPFASILALVGTVEVTLASTVGLGSRTFGFLGLGVAVAATVIRWEQRRFALGVTTVGLCVAVLVASAPLTGAGSAGDDSPDRAGLVGRIEPYLATVFENDTRLASPKIATRRRVASEWARAAKVLDHRLSAFEDLASTHGHTAVEELVTGARGLFDSNVLEVARELGGYARKGHPPIGSLTSANTFERSDREIERYLTPTREDGAPRILVVIEGRSPPFIDDLGWYRIVPLAERRGWRVDSTIPLPDRGQVVLYTHPANSGHARTARGAQRSSAPQ